ncbi:MAG: hypothetical protein RMK30_08155 [Anaerolineae bacterium]|nr:hypothetical protein [Anaerolineae bacterium]
MTRKMMVLALFMGFALGLTLGLYISWGLLPVRHYEGPPSALKESLKKDYVYLISAAYVQEGDLAKAQERLKSLGYKDLAAILPQVLSELEGRGAPEESLMALAMLARALGVSLPALQTFLPPPTPIPTPTPAQILPPTPTPTPSPSPTPGPSFVLKFKERECKPEGEPSLIEVEVINRDGTPLPGVELIISWERGEERIFTGLKPGKSPGYADFEMEPGVSYWVRLGMLEGQEAVNLASSGEDCPPERPVISWRLTFQEMP